MKKAKAIVSEVVKKADRVVSTAQTKSAKVITAAAKGSAKIAGDARREVARATKVAEREVRAAQSSAAAMAAAERSRAVAAEEKASRATEAAKAVKAALAASEADKEALFAGDPNDPRLSGRGRMLARVLDEGRKVSQVRLERSVEFEKKKRVKAEQVAEAAEGRAAHLRTLKNKALQEKRKAKRKAANVLKQTLKLKGGGLSKCASNKLPEAMRERVEAAEAVAAETEKEKIEERVVELNETLDKLRSRLDKKSRVAFERLLSEPSGVGGGARPQPHRCARQGRRRVFPGVGRVGVAPHVLLP